MSKISRRQSLKFLGVGSVGAGLTMAGCDTKSTGDHTSENKDAAEHNHVAQSVDPSDRDKQLLKEKFFTDQERKTVRTLADIIIPKDERSGSASDAGVPEFIEFMMLDQPYRQTAMRGGLAWLNNRCLKVHGKDFVDSDDAQRKAILDEIAFPAKGKAKKEITQGISFFNSFRDLTATGFWTSKIGIDDLKYIGNVANPNWNGCPDEACNHLGVQNSA
ncbi:gluconate 2-dehydrogenase subunit 3 family protein [Rhodocytophaga aerolata]|uniref:Gluconate 2-dehydrogenase subunit 3 family protein n=1 Tax=Rhodocytophaga aerolata TaxID=455078 RepID=A0ABT8RA87_9BACT|nr:gluconate 2-dehydrogenase subunit 3 family protein [Rhodocytophaga aerolata]MDO1449015.1 gluconate 2-dehydrogenase subunit 3 family protein [Rhodocytophaga aerolata]